MTEWDRRIEVHSDAIVLAMIAIGFGLRIANATYAALNPDEALHFLISLHTRLGDVLQTSTYHAHPPLLYVFLWLWRRVGDSELMLRLPLAFAGSAFVWFVYRWAVIAVDKRTALLAAGLLAFSPSLIGVTTEVRQYAPMLLFTSAALYTLEVAFARRSGRWLAMHLCCLVLAIFCHYSVAWFTAAVGVYGLTRLVRGGLPHRLVAGWVATQATAAGCYLALYRFHLTAIDSGPLREMAVTGYLRHFFPDRGTSLWRFFATGTDTLFAYHLASVVAGRIGLALFCLGLAWLVGTGRWRVALLMVVPFVGAFAGSLLRLTPYGGSRHSSVLAPFVAVGTSTGLAAVLSLVVGRRMAPVVAALTVLAIVWPRIPVIRAEERLDPSRQRHIWWDATAYMRTTIPPGSIVLTDSQTALQLGYYVGRDRDWYGTYRDDGLVEYAYGGYRVMAATEWRLHPRTVEPRSALVRRAFALRPDTPIWIVVAGRNSAMYEKLAARYPVFRTVSHVRFGKGVLVLRAPPTGTAWERSRQ